MLVGNPPFRGQNPRELFMQIRSKTIRIPSDVVISTDLQQLLLRVSAWKINLSHTQVAPRNQSETADFP